MTERAAIAAGLVALIARGVPALAAGEGGTAGEPSPLEVEKAQMHFELGLEAYEDEKYAQALVHFLDSYEINPLDELLYNIGFCYEQIGQEAKAVDYYRRYLDTLPEDEEKERAKVLAQIEVIEGVEDEGGQEGKAKRLKKRVTGKYKGDWMHGIALTVAYDLDVQDAAYPESFFSGLGFRGGYHVRLLDRKLLLSGELGFLSVRTVDQHYYNIIVDLGAGGRVGAWVGGTLQLYLGGIVDLKWYQTRRNLTTGTDDPRLNYFMIGLGPFARLYWHWSERVGLFVGVEGAVGLVPKWTVYSWDLPLRGFIFLRLGIFFGVA